MAGLLLGLAFSFCYQAQGAYDGDNRKMARVVYSAGVPALDNQYKSNWLTSVVDDSAAGIAVIHPKSGIFAGTPICWCNSEASATNCQALASSATSVTVTQNGLLNSILVALPLLLGIVGADSNFEVWCEYPVGA